jgi:hypothetical protein
MKQPRVTWATVMRSVYGLGGEYQLSEPLDGPAPRSYALMVYEMGVPHRMSPWLTLRELKTFIAGFFKGRMHERKANEKELCDG